MLAAVHGPAEAVRGKGVSVIFPQNASCEGFLAKILSQVIITSSFAIQIVIHLYADDGSVPAVAFLAAITALMDAGIELKYAPVAIMCAKKDDEMILDPTKDEEKDESILLLVVDGILVGATGTLNASPSEVLAVCSLAYEAAPALTKFWRVVMDQQISRESQTLYA